MDHGRWHKFMSHSSWICFSFPLNPQVLLYDGHDINFDDRILKIFWGRHIQSFFLKVGNSVHGQPKDNVPNLKLKNLMVI